MAARNADIIALAGLAGLAGLVFWLQSSQQASASPDTGAVSPDLNTASSAGSPPTPSSNPVVPQQSSTGVYQTSGGDATAHQIEGSLGSVGGAIGGPIGGVIGSVVGDIAGLFTGHEHYTPGGVAYKQASAELDDNANEIIQLENEIRAHEGMAALPLIQWATGGTTAKMQQLSRMAASLGVQVAGTVSAWQQAYSNGTVDEILQLQQSAIQQLQQALANIGL